MAVVWEKLAYEDDVVTKAFFTEDTFAYASAGSTPVATSPADVMAALSGHAGAEFSMNTQKIGGVVDPTTAQQAATKNYVDTQVATANEFTELTDTPAAYAGEGSNIVRVNAAPDALEFVTPAVVAATMALDDIGVPDAAVDFDLQEATDLVIMTVADIAAKDALAAAATEVGQLLFVTATLDAWVCTESEA